MIFRSAIVLSFLLLLILPAESFSAGADKEKDMKLALDELKGEVVLLQRQVRDLQGSLDRTSGQLNTLITQIGDNVAAIRQAQGRVAESAATATREVSGLNEKMTDTASRIDHLSEQIAALKKIVENLPKMPAFTQITPGNPDQLFAAAYGDYSRGNYDLAISEFRQYVDTYPSSEMADNAQYWIGEAYYAKGQYSTALTEFEKVQQLFPKGDKVPAARFKKAMCLSQLGQTEAANAEFQAIIRWYPRSTEAVLAKQQIAPK